MKDITTASESTATHLLGQIYSILIRNAKDTGDSIKKTPSAVTEGEPNIHHQNESKIKETYDD
jgi:hypothetical protein